MSRESTPAAPGGKKPKTGTVVKTRDGRWQAMITLADGSRKRVDPPFPVGTSKEYAQERSKFWSEDAQRRGLRRKKAPPATIAAGGTALSTWLDTVFEHRVKRGLKRQDRGDPGSRTTWKACLPPATSSPSKPSPRKTAAP
jgi:hypothetical protein